MDTDTDIRRLICIGRDAKMTKAIMDLDFPPKPVVEKLFIIVDDEDVHLLHGVYRPEQLRYVPMGASYYQLDFLQSRHIPEWSLDDARAWIKAQ